MGAGGVKKHTRFFSNLWINIEKVNSLFDLLYYFSLIAFKEEIFTFIIQFITKWIKTSKIYQHKLWETVDNLKNKHNLFQSHFFLFFFFWPNCFTLHHPLFFNSTFQLWQSYFSDIISRDFILFHQIYHVCMNIDSSHGLKIFFFSFRISCLQIFFPVVPFKCTCTLWILILCSRLKIYCMLKNTVKDFLTHKVIPINMALKERRTWRDA